MLSPINQARIKDIDARAAAGWIVPDDFILALKDEDLGDAISDLSDGQTLLIPNGEYPGIGKLESCADGITIMAQSKWGVTFKARSGDTIYMDDNTGDKYGEITFRGIRIEAGGRAAITTNSRQGISYKINLEDCIVDGGWSHVAKGPLPGFQDWGQYTGKWGLNIHLHDGYVARTTIRNIRKEHGDYTHTYRGDRLWYKVAVERCGRGATQCVGRYNEAGFSEGQFALVRCRFRDNTLNDGGKQITIGGNRETYIEDVECTFGQDRAFLADYLVAHPSKKRMGAGHFVCWSDSMGGVPRQDPTHLIEFAGRNLFANAPGCGSAPVMGLKHQKAVIVSEQFAIHAEGQPVAVEFALGTGLTLNTEPYVEGAVVLV